MTEWCHFPMKHRMFERLVYTLSFEKICIQGHSLKVDEMSWYRWGHWSQLAPGLQEPLFSSHKDIWSQPQRSPRFSLLHQHPLKPQVWAKGGGTLTHLSWALSLLWHDPLLYHFRGTMDRSQALPCHKSQPMTGRLVTLLLDRPLSRAQSLLGPSGTWE